MKLQKTIIIPMSIMVIITAFISGCASGRSGVIYSRDEARKVQTVENGQVESVKNVLIEGTKTLVGTVAGGAVGGVAGSAVGSGSGRTLATVVGALVGAAAGAAAEEGITKKEAFEIVVRKDNGQTIVVVQEADVIIRPGDRVRIITGADGTTRVSK